MTSRIPAGELQPYWGDPATFEATLRARRDESSGPLRDEFTTQVARALGLQGRFDEASAELDSVSSDDPVVAQRVALERGRILNSSGDAEAAVAPFTAAFELGADEFLTVDALHMLAITDRDNSEEWTRRGLRIAMTSHDADVERWQGSLLNNHAWNLADAGRESEALTVFERADEWFAERGTPVQRSRARWAVAHLLRRTGDNAGAREILGALLAQDPGDTAAAAELALLPRS
ncbi:hypothetical protein BW730_05405 [Tessaracoccus aquimaris]|uniref:Uncharacterized protein n=1 Tax=Tessaracoccus aquimaris TaxID=1332264 RepID=A0A1Q2CLQ5_9ACTN|nr:tetratricopeptide repeat protein [Tessaracoccus aquimaris]AQP47036.1 hypothetical protein BW730_05405 [Tessaracoccus aquimaris]